MLDALKIDRADLVTHDIGNMVGYAFAAEHRDRVTRFVIIDAPLPGIGAWKEIIQSHALWHFSFWGPMPNVWWPGASGSISTGSGMNSPLTRKTSPRPRGCTTPRLYAQPGAMHAGFSQFKAFDQDAIDNLAFVAEGKLTMPVLAIGGEKSFGPMMAEVMRYAATNVQEGIVPKAGHWVMEENPKATISLILDSCGKHG